MALTRAQLIAGDSSKGTVLSGQVQGVKQGAGVLIANDGTISFNSETSEGVVKTNNPEAFNGYVWPSASISEDNLTYIGTENKVLGLKIGYGLSKVGSSTPQALKPMIPIVGPGGSQPETGTDAEKASPGSLYWNSEANKLFICNSSNSWVQVSYDPPDLQVDLLTGKYVLYVNPEIGSDIYIEGEYEPGIPLQQTRAGYTPQKPFKTIQRAALEVARIQNGLEPQSALFDRFLIQCSVGSQETDNSPGSNSVAAWSSGFIPTFEDLAKLNTYGKSGVILPRGVSVIGEDLRKTVIRPSYVPDKNGDIENDRGSIFRITGGAFFFNFTFKDKTGYNQSHHLLDCFSFVSEADLEDYYDKVRIIFSQPYDNDAVNPGETEIVAPQPPGEAIEETDGTFGSSPYIFNCSVRSLYGLCGLNADGSQVTGFRSVVTAQFTGVSLQKDLTCWQKYNTGPKTWTNTITNYGAYIFVDPNNVRMDPSKRSFHIRAINNAFIQEVSVFAIGHGIHHWVHSGGEVSITNSNSSFGGCAALAQGYKSKAFVQDTNWNVASINLATNMTDQTTNVKNIYLGVVSSSTANNSLNIFLTEPLEDSLVYPGIPNILAELNYTLKEDSYLWIENSQGPDWRSPLAGIAWDPSTPDKIVVKVAMENQNGNVPGGTWPNLEGSRVYIRRLADSRSQEKRRYSINLTNTDANVRTPLRDYVIQTTDGGSSIIGPIPEDDMTVINKSGPVPIGNDPVSKKAQVVLQRSNTGITWDPLSPLNYYRPGDTVNYQNKHFTCTVQNSDLVFDPEKWNESYVHMPSDYNAYDYLNNVAPVIYFDNDTDGNTTTITCGYNLTTCWTTDTEIIKQYRTATDYRGVYQFLIGIGFTGVQIDNLLVPQTTANRYKNPASSVDMLGYTPSVSGKAANALANWPVEFRRPSIVRMFSHAWEWAGFLNYTKALPEYQKDLSAQNQFTYYFTNEKGGKVYATGYNQEGYLVTPAGLTDLSTGATTSVSNIGSPITGVDIPTYYPNLSVDNLTVNQSALFSGTFIVNGSIQADNVYPLANEGDSKAGTSAFLASTPAFSVPKDASGMTGAAILPSGTNTQRAAITSLVSGMLRFNTSYSPNSLESYDATDSKWRQVAYVTDVGTLTNLIPTNGSYLPSVGIYNDIIINAGVTVYVDSTTYLVARNSIQVNGTINADYTGLPGASSRGSSPGTSQSASIGQGLGGQTGTYNFSPYTTGSGGGAGADLAGTGTFAASGQGGYGGGCIVLKSLGSISIGSAGVLTANGSNASSGNFTLGSDYAWSGSGGGSGGLILLQAEDSLTLSSGSQLSVKGGNGSNGVVSGVFTNAGGGGGGGGGYIVLNSPSLADSSTKFLLGGTGGLTVVTGSGASGASGAGFGGVGGVGSDSSSNGATGSVGQLILNQYI
jgi:hypothetical protein